MTKLTFSALLVVFGLAVAASAYASPDPYESGIRQAAQAGLLTPNGIWDKE
jgi:hypothetical protein